ncbi:MAG: aspartate kinase, partial [Rubricoccaceae bacterium]|nr:aspartate kinase [Rubricoccaceae bacterium]
MASSLPILVSKFGGTSVGSPERVREVVELVVRNGEGRKAVVASAFGGVTDRLLDAINAAKKPDGDYEAILMEIRQRHHAAVQELTKPEEQPELTELLDSFWTEIRELLGGVRKREASDARTMDAIVSAGERSSVPIVAAAFRAAGHPAIALDTRLLIRTDATHGEAVVDFETTNIQFQDAFKTIPDGTIAVVTGFIASTEQGATTTLGRSGSDYTATILANALNAKECVIWTDVDGVLSADPRLVPEAFTLPNLSYEEAGELAHFGAKVLHPRTMRPLQAKGIPLRIKNTMRPDHPGTVIGPERELTEYRIKAITSVRDVALIRLIGTGVFGAPHLTARAFTALAGAGIDVLLIAQASSEGSLCFAVRGVAAEPALELLKKTFEKERGRGNLRLLMEPDNAVIAAVGDFMRDAPGLAGRMFGTLGRARVNVRAIAQGASEHNISAAIANEDAALAVQALHESFALRRTRAHVFLIGMGGLGQRVLSLLNEQSSKLRDEHRLNFKLVGVANSTRVLFDKSGLSWEAAQSFVDTGRPSTL